MLTVLAWFIGGGVVRTLATAALSGVVAMSAGYIKGRIDAMHSHEVAALRQTISNMEAEASARSSAEAAAAKQAEEDAKTEAATAATFATIEEAITNAKEVPSGFHPGFLSGLRRLK